MNENVLKELKNQFVQELHGVNHMEIYTDNDSTEQSSYWSAIEDDFSNVVDAERDHLLYR